MIYLSTVVAAEYGIGGDINDLPYDAPKVRVVPFSLRHARKAADCAKFAYKQKRKGALTLEKRIVIPNDTKIIAQAEVEGTDWFVARDNNCRTVHEMLKNGGLLRFNYLDFRTPVGEFAGSCFELLNPKEIRAIPNLLVHVLPLRQNTKTKKSSSSCPPTTLR